MSKKINYKEESIRLQGKLTICNQTISSQAIEIAHLEKVNRRLNGIRLCVFEKLEKEKFKLLMRCKDIEQTVELLDLKPKSRDECQP